MTDNNRDKKEGWFFIKLIIFIFSISLLYNIINYKTDYVAIKPGPLYKVTYSEGIKEDTKGSWNMSTIAVKRLNSIDYLIYYFTNNSDIYPLSKDSSNSKSLDMLGAKEIASVVAESIIFGIKPDIDLVISYVMENSNATRIGLLSGDRIISVDDIEINNYDMLIDILKDGSYSIKIERDNKIISINDRIVNKGEKLGVKLVSIGQSRIDIDKINTRDVSGASGGLIFTLLLLDHFTNGDLTNGKKISGSGTINLDGSVGKIEGINYKYKAALSEDVDIFFTPESNYNEIKNSSSSKTKIIVVKNVFDAINYLCNNGSNSELCKKI